MLRQMLTSLVLLAFVNLLMGCSISSTEQVAGPAVSAIQPEEKVTQLVLVDGTVVNFDSKGGIFHGGAQDGIKGKSTDGNDVFVPLNFMWLCRTGQPISLPLAALDTAHIAEVVLADNSFVMFDPPTASFNKRLSTVRGTTALKGTVTYALKDLRSIRAGHPAYTRINDIKNHPDIRISEVIDKQYRVFTFDSTGGCLASVGGGFFGKTEDGAPLMVPTDSVLYAGVERSDVGASVVVSLLAVIGVIGVIGLIALATKQSCPFIYSYDGQRYVFDAEPLGGTIAPVLARTDISKLDHARPVDGEYRLLVRNEVPETQYIDRMTMLLVDHPASSLVYPDLQGTFYEFQHISIATSSRNENGRNLMNFLRASDRVMWQTHLPLVSRDTNVTPRHEITVTLPKPANATKAWLVTNIGTSSWGSNMIRKTIEYRGNTAQAWLASLTPGSQSLAQMNQFIEREEMYHLKTWMKEGSVWQQATTILGQGPLISEDRVYPIDVSNVSGDSLVLRFDPPKGFWTFDYIGVSYEEPTTITPVRVSATWAQDQQGTSILERLTRTDSVHYTMPEVGDYANLRFNAPEAKSGMTRSVYLETSGYYELHLKQDLPEQLARLYNVFMTPGQIVKTLMEEYRAFHAQQLAQEQPSQTAH
jgi:hypothetical protein